MDKEMIMKKVLKKIVKDLEKEIGFAPEWSEEHRTYFFAISTKPDIDTEYLFMVGEDMKRPGLIYTEVVAVAHNGGTEEVVQELREDLFPIVAKHAPYQVDVDPITVH
jgi:hypothetical protein